MKLKKGDKVMVRSGKDKGKIGEVTQVLAELNKVVVDGINMVKRSTKPSAKQPRGGIIERPQPIWASKVGIVTTDGKRPSRVGYALDKSGRKTRVLRQDGNKEVE